MSDIAALFEKDPNDCTDQDIMAIIKEFRSKQQLWKTSGISAAPARKPTRAAKEPGLKMDLSDLGL